VEKAPECAQETRLRAGFVKTRLIMYLAGLALLGLVWAQPGVASSATSGSLDKLRQDTAAAVRGRLTPLLERYCKGACLVTDVAVDAEEQLAGSGDLGFEGVSGDDDAENDVVNKVTVSIQVDDRVTNVNRDRLLTILKNNLQNFGTAVDIVWKPVVLPQIGQSVAKEEQLRDTLRHQVATAIDRVIQTYCPEACVLSAVAVDGKLVTPDEASDVPVDQLVRDRTSNAILKVDNVDVDLSMDAALPEEQRNRIANVIKAKTRFASPLSLAVDVTKFPESYAEKQEKEAKASKDPFGLDRLRQTLKMFRDLAATKEVITTKETTASSKEQTSTENRDSATSMTASKDQVAGLALWQWALLVSGLLLLVGIVAAMFMRFSAASRDARLMMMQAGALPGSRAPVAAVGAATAPGGGSPTSGHGVSDQQRRELTLRMKNEEMHDELVKAFLDSPRVAKETFSRLLQEEGIEETARYVHIFGHLVIFELLNDPNLVRDLFELSEYYHKTSFDFTPEEEHKLLSALKTRVTANEIRVLTRKQMDKFDFLLKLDATQIYNLVSEEKTQVQSIVLTQLDHKRRRAVFDLYQGQAKVDLMRELCRADAIPKEYLSNVAKALHKKVTSRPEFDIEHLRSSDILLDLLEKAELAEQRALMQNLMQTNPEAARGIKLKFVTIEVLPYLKDAHLLEIILGMERDDLLSFLVGTREHIRGLVLSKAPEELAESWVEDLANVRTASEQSYRLVEMKILGRIRSLAGNGVINLLDINDMIFGKSEEQRTAEEGGEALELTSDSSMVA